MEHNFLALILNGCSRMAFIVVLPILIAAATF